VREHPVSELGGQLLPEGDVLCSGEVDEGVINVEENGLN